MKKILFVFLLLVCSCGLERVEREDKIKNVIVIINQNDESSFVVKKFLEDKFELSGQPNYKLILEKTETVNPGFIGSDAFSASFNIDISIKATLKDASSGKTMFTFSSAGSTTYIAAPGSNVSDFINQKAASKNLSLALAEKIYNKIEEHFAFNDAAK